MKHTSLVYHVPHAARRACYFSQIYVEPNTSPHLLGGPQGQEAQQFRGIRTHLPRIYCEAHAIMLKMPAPTKTKGGGGRRHSSLMILWAFLHDHRNNSRGIIPCNAMTHMSRDLAAAEPCGGASGAPNSIFLLRRSVFCTSTCFFGSHLFIVVFS